MQSEFLEADIPVIGPDMNVPLIQKLEFDISGRHDAYSDDGATTNPKASFNWDVIGGLRIRGNWSTSFVAPALEHDVVNGVSANSSITSGTPGTLPVSVYPAVTQLGRASRAAPTASVSCSTSTLMGLNSANSTFDVKPMLGHGWTVGFDYAPDFLPGFTSSVSWWHTTFTGGVTAASAQIDAFNPLLNNRIILFPPTAPGGPACATQAQIAAIIGQAPVEHGRSFRLASR